MSKKKIIVGLSVVAVLLVFAFAASVYRDAAQQDFLTQSNAGTFVPDHAPKMGGENASVFIVEFLDPECESCRSFYPHVKQLLAQYPEDVKLVIRYAPFHQNSVFAVKILEAARKQDKYWETLELLFQYQPEWASHHEPKPELLWTYLPQIGLDIEKLKVDMEDPEIEKNISKDVNDGKTLGVRATPTFFVNGQPPRDFGPDFLKDLVEQELSKSKKSH